MTQDSDAIFPTTQQDASRRSARIRKVVEDCMVRRAAGESLPDDSVTDRHQDLMPELKEELAVLAMIERAKVGTGSSADLPNLLATPQAASRTSVEDLLGFRGYAVTREIHRGGQGVVYEAVQRSTGKHVALKILHDTRFDTGRDRARFEREVHILGLLKHPNIVAIHDSGTISGHRYLVMDLIEGAALGAFDPTSAPSDDDTVVHERNGMASPESKTAAGQPPPSCCPGPMAADIEATVRQFIKICDAVNAAHLHGIIHRDLKPSNILIDADGEPHVLDFGLAKLTESSALAAQTMTAEGQFVGSLPWASPEQAGGAAESLDIRTDVYSLGVILYQLVTGRFPYPVIGNWRTVAETIVNTPPAPPMQIRTDLPDDLQRIILKALAKDPSRRYQSAGELGKDLSRYLASEPISARGDSPWYIVSTLARKHRVKAGIAAAFLLLVVGSAAVMALLYQGERRALKTADAERDKASKALQLAELRLETAQHAEAEAKQENAKATAVSEFLTQMLEASDPMYGNKDVKVADVLDAATRSIHEKFPDDPLVEARIRQTIGQTYQGLGDYIHSEEQFRAAYQLRVKELGPDAPETLESAYVLASTLWMVGKIDDAEPLAKAVADAKSAGLGEGLNDEAAASLALYAYILNARGRHDEAVQISRRVLDYFQTAHGEDHERSITAINDLAFSLDSADQNEEAIELYREALEKSRRVLGPDHALTQSIQTNLANALRSLGRIDEVEPLITAALESRRRTLPPNHPFIADCLCEMAGVHGARGNVEAALADIEEALQINEVSLGKDNWRTAGTLAYHCNVLSVLKRFDEAEAAANRAFTILKKTWGQHQSLEQMMKQVIAGLYTRWDRPDKVREWEAIFEKLDGAAPGDEPAADASPSTDEPDAMPSDGD